MDINSDLHSQLIVKLFFDLDKKDGDRKIFCRCCENYFKDNKGFQPKIVNILLYLIKYIINRPLKPCKSRKK